MTMTTTTTKRLLIDLVARHIDSPDAWYNFSKADPDFQYVCNKLLDQDDVDYTKVCIHTYRHSQNGTYWYWYLQNGMKHGPETIDRVYSCYYRNGKMHGREWEKKHNGNYYMCYEADWKHGLHHGWEIEYWGKGWGLNMFQYVNGKKHGLSVYYTNDEANANTPIEFGIWVNDKEVVRSELAKTL